MLYVVSAPSSIPSPSPHPKSVRIRGSIDLTPNPPPPPSLPLPTYIARKCVAYAAAAAAAVSVVSKDFRRGEIRTWQSDSLTLALVLSKKTIKTTTTGMPKGNLIYFPVRRI